MATNSKGLTLRSLFFKKIFDLIVSLLGLLILFPIITIAWIVSAIDTKSNGFFTQNRIGKNGKIFRIIKIKTMKKKGNDNINSLLEELDNPKANRKSSKAVLDNNNCDSRL